MSESTATPRHVVTSALVSRELHWMALGISALLLFAFGLYTRVDALGSSLWVDEFGTFWVAQDSFSAMLSRSLAFQGQSPLYYVLPWGALHLGGESEVALRLPSVILGLALPLALYAAGRSVGGMTAGGYAAALAWLLPAVVRASAEARPYALVLLAATVAIAGFASAVRSGRRGARLAWILGGAATAWAHYVHYPLVGGLFVGYVLFPGLRRAYTPRMFVADAAAQWALVALTVPQVLALAARRGTLAWLDEWNYFVFLAPVLPLLPALAVACVAARRQPVEPVERELAACLWLSAAAQIIALEALAMIGVNLLSPRYFVSLVVPGALLTAYYVARARGIALVAALTLVAALVLGELAYTRRAFGSYAGLGHDDWRGAVAVLSDRIATVERPLVLYRSGFVEEDVEPLGAPSATTLAPLRSPGRPPWTTEVITLGFRWGQPRRAEYFDRVVAPRIEHESRFFLLGARWGPEERAYVDRFGEWVAERWPGRFIVSATTFGGVQLLEYREHDDGR